MAIKYGFFDSVAGDRKYTAANIGDYLQGIITSGVYADDSSSLQVLAGDGMQVLVQPGRAMLNFKYLENDAPLAFTLSAGGSQDRVDAIVARVDMLNRLCEIVVKQGTPAASPVAPTMTRTDVKMEYMLASVYVSKLATAITQENITDTRGNTDVCGWVTGIIDQVPTGVLLAQYQAACAAELAAIREYAVTQRAEFETWFSALADDLQVLTYIQEYRNMVTLEEATDTVHIGIADFVADEDVLMVNYRGLVYMEEDYTLHGTGNEAYVVLSEPRNAGDPIEFRVLKSKIGTAAMAATFLAADDNGTILTDGGAALVIE